MYKVFDIDIFISSFKIIKKNLFFGVGTDNFSNYCNNYKFEKIYCESHSHNLYLNILSENGILVLLLFFYLLYLTIYKNYNYKNKINYKTINLIVIIIFLNPISVSGDFFSTWTGTIFWYTFGIYKNLDNN